MFKIPIDCLMQSRWRHLGKKTFCALDPKFCESDDFIIRHPASFSTHFTFIADRSITNDDKKISLNFSYLLHSFEIIGKYKRISICNIDRRKPCPMFVIRLTSDLNRLTLNTLSISNAISSRFLWIRRILDLFWVIYSIVAAVATHPNQRQ